MVPGYPKDLHHPNGGFVTVQNQYEEEEYQAKGWNQSKPTAKPSKPAGTPKIPTEKP